MASKNKNNPPSPKLKYGAMVSTIISLLAGMLSQGNGQFSDILGDWTLPVAMLVVAAIYTVVGYAKHDPKRIVPNVKKFYDKVTGDEDEG